MTSHFDPPLAPRNGRDLQVLVITRISTVHQDLRSLDDQSALCQGFVRDRWPGPVRFQLIQGRGSGETLDRQDLADAEAAVESAMFDLVVVEDLGRICRRNRAIDFCELCEDSDTRLIAINDSLDTARDDWRLNAFFASFKHESGNKDTSRRIRRSLRHRFQQGGVVQTLPFGYVKPDGCKDDSEICKIAAADRIYDRWFKMIEEGASFAEVADMLNSEGVPVGPYCRMKHWTSFMVGRITRNPILKGFRVRNDRMSRRINKTGHRRSIKAPPEERLERYCPHLVFIEAGRFDRVNRLVAERNAKFKRNGRDGMDPRRGISKKRTPWPAQHIQCGVCGRPYYRGGHGRTDHLMCSGARAHKCWNGVTFHGPTAARNLTEKIRETIEALPEFESTFLHDLRCAMNDQETNRRARMREYESRQKSLDREEANIMAVGRSTGALPSVVEELKRIHVERERLAIDNAELVRQDGATIELPSMEQIRAVARQAFNDGALESPEFARFLRRLIPTLVVKPYRLIDDGNLVLRAHLIVDLTTLLDGKMDGGTVGELLQHELVVDLFVPPQRVKFLKPVVELIAQGVKQREIGSRLGITQTAVQRAAALARLMESLGVEDPYQPVLEPPSDCGRMRRHRRHRYKFEPLEGF